MITYESLNDGVKFKTEEVSDKIKITYLGSIESSVKIILKSLNGKIIKEIDYTFTCMNHWFVPNFNYISSDKLIISNKNNSLEYHTHNISENLNRLNIKVSVIIPCYNFGNYIEHSIYSVLSQKTNFKYEILIGDDCSTDSSESVIKRLAKYNNNIKYFRYNKNIGGRKNIKFLIDNCVGDYIAYLDGDDFWVDNLKLQKQVDFLDENIDYSMCFTGHWIYDRNGHSYPYDNWMGLTNNKTEVNSETLLSGNPISALTKVFRNYKNSNWCDFLDSIPFFDWGHNFFMSQKGKIKYLNFPSAVYRTHDNGVFSSLTQDEIAEKNNKIIKILKGITKSDYK
jgi:glycosyltransferase involved in cell wall biosynthesis